VRDRALPFLSIVISINALIVLIMGFPQLDGLLRPFRVEPLTGFSFWGYVVFFLLDLAGYIL